MVRNELWVALRAIEGEWGSDGEGEELRRGGVQTGRSGNRLLLRLGLFDVQLVSIPTTNPGLQMMFKFLHCWRREIATGLVVVALTELSGCARSLATNVSQSSPPKTDLPEVPKYKVDIDRGDGKCVHMIGRRIEYRMNSVLFSAANGQLRADDSVLTKLTESDLVTIKTVSRTVAVNGTHIWPDDPD